MHADSGAPVSVEADVVIEGDVAHRAMRPDRPAPRRLAAGAGGEVGGGIIARHRVSKAAPRPRPGDRHDQSCCRRAQRTWELCPLDAGARSVQRAHHGDGPGAGHAAPDRPAPQHGLVRHPAPRDTLVTLDTKQPVSVAEGWERAYNRSRSRSGAIRWSRPGSAVSVGQPLARAM